MRDKAETLEILIDAVSQGVPLRTACLAAGVSRSTLYRWTKADSIARRIRKARMEGKLFHLRNIREHSKTDWRASAWILERMYPKEFGRRTIIEMPRRDSDDDVFVRVLTPEEAREIALARARAAGSLEPQDGDPS